MQRFKNILFVAEPTADNSAALTRAIALAINNQASLTVIGLVTALPRDMQMAIVAVTPTELLDSVVADKHHELAEMVKATTPDERLPVVVKVLVGTVFLEIIREVLRNDHDLVIKAAEQHESVKETLFGSTDMHLMRKCPSPVWIIKPTDHEHYRRILAAVDQDPENATTDALNRQILEMSSSLAVTEVAELHIVHAWHAYQEEYFRSARFGVSLADVAAMVQEEKDARTRWLNDLVTTQRTRESDARKYLEPQLHIVKGQARHEIPRVARELDVELIVMGTLGRVGIPGFFMGNTAEEILKQIDCSVLAIKPPGFVSPVTLELDA
jgi:nucleotide-binding universal stress UspA family protein